MIFEALFSVYAAFTNHIYDPWVKRSAHEIDEKEETSQRIKEYLQIELEAWLALGTNQKLDPEEIRRAIRQKLKLTIPHGIARQIEEHRLSALFDLDRLRREHFTSLDWPDLSPLEVPMPPANLTLSLPSSQMHSVGRFTRALLIGINDYHSAALTGSCEDVQSMTQFLKDYLSLPESRIKLLRNEEATRAAILEALHTLEDGSVLFYFAGHGSSQDLPVDDIELTSGDSNCLTDSVPTICPFDRGVIGPDGHVIQDIYIHELYKLFSQISKKPANRVIAIFDCCFTPTNSTEDSRVRNRCLKPLASNATSANGERDQYIQCWNSWDPSVSGIISISACRNYEPAFELTGEKRGGLFTNRFLDVATSKDSWEVTYEGFIELMGTIGEKHTRQTPTLRGKTGTLRVWDDWTGTFRTEPGPCLCGCDAERARLRWLERKLWNESMKAGPLEPHSLIELQQDKVRKAESAGTEDGRSHLAAQLNGLLQLRSIRQKSTLDCAQASSRLIRNRPCQYWAVVVGINAYLQVEPLRGCVADAYNMKNYLLDYLKVPEAHVSLLVDAEATWTNIWQTLLSLVDKSNAGDQMILYFSGRGTMYDTSETRAICPVDRGALSSDGKRVRDITETDVRDSLNGLRKVNKAYMTMIWDCSFATTVQNSKSTEPPQYHATMNRYASPLKLVDEDTFHPFQDAGGSDSIPLHPNTTSPETEARMYSKAAEQRDLLLTGCRKGEAGYEGFNHERNQYQGQFTTSFLRVAIQSHEYGHMLMYSDIIGRCQIEAQWGAARQTPEVIGFRKHDPLWE